MLCATFNSDAHSYGAAKVVQILNSGYRQNLKIWYSWFSCYCNGRVGYDIWYDMIWLDMLSFDGAEIFANGMDNIDI